MSQSISQIKTLKVIKAFRGQSLTIDLGVTLTGTLSAWIKKKATDATYRSFTIVDNRYLFLPKEKAQDIGSELVEGRWYFDVRELPLGETDPNLEQIKYKGTIDFSNNITDSNGVEIAQTPESESGMINLSNTSSVYGTAGQIVKAKNLIIKIPELKVVKAIRGQALTIDLGKTYDGALEAWMKTDPNDETYRSFTIVDGRYLYLPKDKTQDYYDVESGDLIQAIEGKWYYDVRLLPTGATNSNDEQTIYKGEIYFENQVTGSAGQELVYSNGPSRVTTFSSTIGNGSLSSIPVTHNIGNQFLQVSLYEVSTSDKVECEIELTSPTVTTFKFNIAPTVDQYRVVITG